MKPLPLPKLSERNQSIFWANVQRGRKTECWPWLGGTNGKKYSCLRYGQWNLRQDGFHRNVRPHRVAYELLRGPIPEGLTIDHLCLNTLCCNPWHAELVTLQVNISRRTGDSTPTKYRNPSTPPPASGSADAGGWTVTPMKPDPAPTLEELLERYRLAILSTSCWDELAARQAVLDHPAVKRGLAELEREQSILEAMKTTEEDADDLPF